jgi:membrane-associated phospholipid phosphatase
MKWLFNWTINDWLTLGYLGILSLAWFGSDPSPDRSIAGPMVLGILATFVVGVLGVVRCGIGPERLRALTYRLVQFGCIEASYFSFQHLLPAVNPGTVDLELYQLDLSLFGVEPAIWMDRFIGPVSSEWFSFFYFSYYLLLLAYVIPLVFASKDTLRLGDFGLGMTIIGTVGQGCYLLVPGFGPYHALPDHFLHALPNGFWWRQVTSLVHAGGAQKDIFPSLHTALPTFITLFTWRHRKQAPYSWAWPIAAFMAANIIISTMFLRWHYLIDVIAGFTLAVSAALISGPLSRWEQQRRKRLGFGAAWPAWSPETAEDAPKNGAPSLGTNIAS